MIHIHSTFEVGQGFGSVPDPERPKRVSALRQPTLTTWIDPEVGRTYINVPAYPAPASPIQTPPSPEWSSGSLPISPVPSTIPSPIPSLIASPVATLTTTILVDEDQFIEIGAQLELYGGILQDHTQRLDTMPPTLFAEIDRDVRDLYTRSRAVRDEIFSQRYRLRSLEHEQERTAITFGALWRLLLALEAWHGRQAAMQDELQEMIGRVTALEQERDHRETRSLGESEETPLEETNSLEGQCIELGNEIPLRGLDWSGVGVDTAYPRHGYAVSSLMDTAYWSSE
ncbi:hypothetical protein Tco_0298529 [Tanacetum coccineum]